MRMPNPPHEYHCKRDDRQVANRQDRRKYLSSSYHQALSGPWLLHDCPNARPIFSLQFSWEHDVVAVVVVVVVVVVRINEHHPRWVKVLWHVGEPCPASVGGCHHCCHHVHVQQSVIATCEDEMEHQDNVWSNGIGNNKRTRRRMMIMQWHWSKDKWGSRAPIQEVAVSVFVEGSFEQMCFVPPPSKGAKTKSALWYEKPIIFDMIIFCS